MSVSVRPPLAEEKRVGLTLAEPVLVTLTTPERLLTAIQRRWRVLVFALALCGTAGIVAGLFLPHWYESTSTFAVIPVDDPTAPIGADTSATALPLFSQILSSRRVADEVVEKLQLARAYRTRTAQDARSALLNHVTVWTDRRSNVVTLTVEDQLPQRATAIARAFGEVGLAVNSELWSAKSTEARKRLEARLTEVSNALSKAEDQMRAFREREHVVDIGEQVKASVSEGAFLERMKNDKKVSLHFNQSFASADAPEVRRSEVEARSAQAALQGVIHGTQRGPLLSLDNVPRLEQEHARLKREIDTNSSLYEILVRQVEQLRATEARPGGRAEVLDPPSEPRQPSRPSRLGLLFGGLMAGLVLGMLLVIWPRSRFAELRPSIARVHPAGGQ